MTAKSNWLSICAARITTLKKTAKTEQKKYKTTTSKAHPHFKFINSTYSRTNQEREREPENKR